MRKAVIIVRDVLISAVAMSLLFILLGRGEKCGEEFRARAKLFADVLPQYTSVLWEAMSDPLPTKAHRYGKLVILQRYSPENRSPQLSRVGGISREGEMVASNPSEVGSIVLITLDFKMIRPAEGHRGALL